jgi:hypothetical protein
LREYEKGKTTICVVNYKTEELTKLCLRSIRKFTKAPYKVVVVDNDSGDASLDYLRTLKWITLIERPGEMKGSGSWAHGTGLDKGLEICDTEFFMAMHSDTFVRREGWLGELLSRMSPETACVGGGKLDLKPKWQVLLKRFTDVKKLKRKLTEKKRLDFYIRTICALYRTKILHDENLTFAMNVEDGVTCGKQLYYELVDRKFPTEVVSEWKMAELLHHLAHATMVLNPEFTVRERTERKFKKKIERVMASPEIQSVLNDDSLDL